MCQSIRLMTFGELRACFRVDDDVPSIIVCLQTLFESDEETVILVSHNQRVDVDYDTLASAQTGDALTVSATSLCQHAILVNNSSTGKDRAARKGRPFFMG